MIERIAQHIGSLRLAGRERGGVALIMLIGFIGLAVPITIASVQTGAQLSRNSRVYDSRLTALYNSGAGVEAALYELLNDPDFDDGLTPANPDKVITVDNNGETVTVTVTKVFTSNSVEGQGLIVSKTVSPTSTPPSTPTTFTYTITIQNEGTDVHEIDEITDFLPPGFTYSTSSTSGITTNDPVASPGGSDKGDYYLNDGASPLPLDPNQGTDQVQALHEPAQGLWEAVPDYWQTAAYSSDGLFRATDWKQRQWWEAGHSSNQWRWKVQRVRGAAVTDLFTSISQAVGDTNWTEEDISHNPGDISIQSGDKLRLRLEVYSNRSSQTEREMKYRWGGYDDSGPDYDSRTDIPILEFCDVGPQYEILWTLFPKVQIQPQAEMTLTFQATASVPDGTYYNQVEVKYDPWWTTDDVKTRSPQTAPITVGTGTPLCMHGSSLKITQTVDPQEAAPGVETEFTYTITLENVSPVTLWTCKVKDWLPPTFTYVTGSTSGAIDREPEEVKWKADEGRWEIKWDRDQYPANGFAYMFTIGSGQSKSFSFKALATLEAGMIYYNEVKEVKASQVSTCDDNDVKTLGGTDPNSAVIAKGTYDISAVAADGTVLARVILSSLNGTVDILSWQEN